MPKAEIATSAVPTLTIVGTGISIGQTTTEAIGCIKAANVVVSLVADPVTLNWLKRHNKNLHPLNHLYSKGKPRAETYAEIASHVASLLTSGKRVCFVLYGHPGVYANPSHALLRWCNANAIPARMLPGVSSEACLFADLGIDPGDSGCQSFEATDFLIHGRIFDPTSVLILWQFPVVGNLAYPERRSLAGVRILAEQLALKYSNEHEVIVYEAATYPILPPRINRFPLRDLPRRRYSIISTLVVPPLSNRSPRKGMMRRLGFSVFHQ